jgi:hypothetical protein
MYKLKEEPALLFSFLWAMDGNDSLKRVIQQGPADDKDPNKPRQSRESIDTRRVPGDMYISRENVNNWAREVVGQAKVASEGVSKTPTLYL